MASTPFSNQRARAARWMHERKDRRVDWWRWTVLTATNSDPECLKLDKRTAFLVFSDFVHDGMLVPVIASDGFEAYTINPGKDELWQRAAHPWKWWIRHNTQRIIEWIISGIIGGVIGIGLLVWWDSLVGN
ncbi:hypothetical protein [Botrimarina hoheduenensis]|uniref:Uncharacterized protein n=1 Tax=Botrimarina hoheduenensis TaxID=2528000 RepID=A0A5C5VY76_9BACT|nr:hypothetical protein [Botrimarina hoheduenensis]TWT42492.1 hypothetical protein Pla111_27970 [Botrimarina hoheduenensis]